MDVVYLDFLESYAIKCHIKECYLSLKARMAESSTNRTAAAQYDRLYFPSVAIGSLWLVPQRSAIRRLYCSVIYINESARMTYLAKYSNLLSFSTDPPSSLQAQKGKRNGKCYSILGSVNVYTYI